MAHRNLQSESVKSDSLQSDGPQSDLVVPASDMPSTAGRAKTVVNWVLALLTIPAAIVVVVVAIGSVMSTAGCSGSECTGPGSFWFGVLFYGAPVLAAATIIVSLFTARRPWGIAVPLCALALFGVDLLVLVLSF
jgi:hypothetical protein